MYHNLYITFGQQTERQNILYWMTASIPWLQPALNFFLNGILIHEYCSLISATFHPFKGTIINLILWPRPEFWYRDMIMHLVLSAFTSRSDQVLALQTGFCAEVYFGEDFIHFSAANGLNYMKRSWTSYSALVTIYTTCFKVLLVNNLAFCPGHTVLLAS